MFKIFLTTKEVELNFLKHETSALDYDLSFLKEAVLIPSASNDYAGVMKVQNLIAAELKKMGFAIKWIPSDLGAPHFLLHAIKKGRSSRSISFIGHADTVLPPGADFSFKVDSLQQKISGPGVADDKGGLCVALRALRNFLSQVPEPLHTLQFFSSPNEELGSVGFHRYFAEAGKVSDYVFGLEPSLPDGSLISSRNGNTWYKISVKGQSAHAGRFGEVAINAAHELSRIICSLYPLNDLGRKTKINVGTLSGGSGHFNVVCGEAQALIDVRFPDLETRNRIHQQLEELIFSPQTRCLETGALAQVDYHILDDCPPLALTSKGQSLGHILAEQISTKEHRHIGCQHTGGAADANYFSSDNAIIDGVGPVGGGLHTINEYVDLVSFYTRSQSLKDTLLKINSN